MDKDLGVYIHIPFCAKKCPYCGFLSEGDKAQDDIDVYIDSLIKEIQGYGAEFKNRYIVDSVFIGGGTPSFIKPSYIENIMDAVKSTFHMADDSEVTIETNPGTLSEDKLKRYIKSGINRISIGFQSLDDDMLVSLGRLHRANNCVESYEMARLCGFDNINIDLMFAIPGQTEKVWEDTLHTVMELGPEHLSFYSLQLEEGTSFLESYKNYELFLPTDEEERKMYHKALEIMKERKYGHYEISNSALDGYRCRHNLKYWSMGEYLGIGLGAHSYVNGSRYNNVTDMERYCELILEGEWPTDMKCYHVDSRKDAMAIYAFTALRKVEGIDMEDFAYRFGIEFMKAYREKAGFIADSIRSGYLTIREGHLSLTEKGIDISNSVMAEFV